MGANLFQQYLSPPRSVASYAAELDQADIRKQAMQQNALEMAALRSKLDESAQANQRAAQLRSALAGLPQGATDDDRINAMRGTGLPEGFSQADALEKSLVERRKGNAAASKDEADALKTTADARYKAIDHHAQDLAYVRTPEDVTAWIDGGIRKGLVPMSARQELLAKAAQYPTVEAFVAASRDASIPVLERARIAAENERNALTNRTSKENNERTNATSRANNAATNAVTMRGQNMTDARAAGTLEQGKTPPGYRKTADGNLEAIPGGPADLKIQGQLNQDTQALNGSISGFDRLATAANEVLQHPGLKGITGLRGAIPNIPGTDAANAEALLGTLKSQVGFGVLQDMRNNSKTGGALGSVSDAEGKRLEANLAALEKSQSLEQYQSNLRKIIKYAEDAKGRVREAYNLKHSGKAGASSAPSAAPSKTVDFADLK